MNWKIWTWPRQIRALKAKLATACDVIERQRKELEHRHRQGQRTQHL
jgi:hypothetical protein